MPYRAYEGGDRDPVARRPATPDRSAAPIPPITPQAIGVETAESVRPRQ